MTVEKAVWRTILKSQRVNILYLVMWRFAEDVLNPMTKFSFKVAKSQVRILNIKEVASAFGDPEEERVGVYLRLKGGVKGHALMMFSLKNALRMVDALSENPPDTTQTLDAMGHSALAELGNLITAHFLNGISWYVTTKGILAPSPPAVNVDMLGAILNTAIIPLADKNNQLHIAEVEFVSKTDDMDFIFWVIPNEQEFKL